MKLDLSLATAENFMTHQHMIGQHDVMLIQPIHIGCAWDDKNDMFRSVVVDMEGNIVSASFKKFYNWGEKPHLTPPPVSLAGATLMEKIDGSTLIFSRWKGHTIIRTRGTVDARKQDNGHEIDVLCQKYAKFITMLESKGTDCLSYIFEWTSPSNQIVINYGYEADMVLTGIIRHDGYTYAPQASLNAFAMEYGLRRPVSYSYDSVEQMKAAVEAFKGIEGLCVYFHDDQKILKVKGAQYLYLHRAKSEISSIEKVMDVYLGRFFELGKAPTYQEFYEYLETVFDHEIAEMARGHVSNIADGMKEVGLIIAGMNKFLRGVKLLSLRKQQADAILQAYGSTGRSSMVFKMLDGKPFVADDYKKLLFQVLK